MGLSREDRCMIQYLKDSGVPHRITSTTNHSAKTRAGYPSRHVMEGTGGMGLAIDAAGPTASRDSKVLGDIFWAFMKVEKQLHELIYAGPQTTFNIKRGKRVPKYAQSGHHDHVHIAVNKGTFIVWPHAVSPPKPPEEKIVFRYVYNGAIYTTDFVFRQHWESGGPGFAIMERNTKDLGPVTQDFHDSLVPAS